VLNAGPLEAIQERRRDRLRRRGVQVPASTAAPAPTAATPAATPAATASAATGSLGASARKARARAPRAADEVTPRPGPTVEEPPPSRPRKPARKTGKKKSE